MPKWIRRLLLGFFRRSLLGELRAIAWTDYPISTTQDLIDWFDIAAIHCLQDNRRELMGIYLQTARKLEKLQSENGQAYWRIQKLEQQLAIATMKRPRTDCEQCRDPLCFECERSKRQVDRAIAPLEEELRK